MIETAEDILRSVFVSEFQQDPIVIFSPGRINLIGEHTDYNNGLVFPAAINRGIFLAIARSNQDSSKIRALDISETLVFDVNQPIKAIQNSWQAYFLGIISELKKSGLEIEQFNVVFTGTIDAGSGMSSSAALENAFVFGLNELFELNLSKKEMIFISQGAEHNYVGVKCGIMDQYASMFGQKDAAIFLDCKSLESEILPINIQQVSILVINTKVKHKLSDSAYNQRRTTCEKVAVHFKAESLRDIKLKDLESSKGVLDQDDYLKASYVLEENNRVLAFKDAINTKNINEMGRLLYESHDGLRFKYKVSCAELDFLVDFGKNCSYVLGSRMMGGGFGGCTINLIQSHKIEEFEQEISYAYQKQFNRQCGLINVTLSDGTKRLQ